jgi:two-component system chemotaxis response regulator CheY
MRALRVVVCDDEIHIRLLIKKVMQHLKYEVIGEAGDGEEAVRVFQEKKPDLLLMDVNMPKMTGTEALDEIMKISPNAFVIMLTSLTDMDTIQFCLDKGAANYIRKDTPVSKIAQLVSEAVIERFKK